MEIAKATGTRSQALRRLTRALTSHGYFHEEADSVFTQTPLSEALRKSGFRVDRLVAAKSPFSVIEAVRYDPSPGRSALKARDRCDLFSKRYRR